MRQTVPALRRAAMVMVAAGSVLCAVFLVWTQVTRDEVGALSNSQLVGMLALFLLPAATAVAWELDRRAAQRDESRALVADATSQPESPVLLHEPHTEEPELARHRRRVAHGAEMARR